MIYSSRYSSPVGDICLMAEDGAITGLYFDKKVSPDTENAAIKEAKRWLDIYFSGAVPSFTPKIILSGTPFQKSVWEILEKIPYGKVISYGDIANIIAKERGVKRMSAQAVGQAVGSNPVSIIVPCHRVVGKDLSLTGYGGGIERKKFLLTLEKADFSRLYSLENIL